MRPRTLSEMLIGGVRTPDACTPSLTRLTGEASELGLWPNAYSERRSQLRPRRPAASCQVQPPRWSEPPPGRAVASLRGPVATQGGNNATALVRGTIRFFGVGGN